MTDERAPGDSAPGPPAIERLLGRLIRRICTSNPFYVISACLVLAGLRMSFDPRATIFQTGLLVGSLALYTLLLAVTACLLVRFNNVWEDVRTVLLLVVVVFLAMSVIFDDIVIAHRGVGAACDVGGLLFAICVSEGLLRGMRLKLPSLYRVPYYLILALFFLYPVGMTPLVRDPESTARLWALFGFSPLAGLVFLTLIPAIRRGGVYVEKNGSPWRWPLYPWTLFVFLGLGVCARSFYLCVSMHAPSFPETEAIIFAPYFLVPFLFAVSILMLEAGIVSMRRGVVRTALLLPVGLVALSMLDRPTSGVPLAFLTRFMHSLGGSPLYLTAVGLLIFYAYASARRVPRAFELLTVALVGFATLSPSSLGIDGLVNPHPLIILGAGLLQAGLAIRRRDPLRSVVAASCLIAAATLAVNERWPTIPAGVFAYHLTLAAVLFLGTIFRGGFASFLRGVAAVMLVGATFAALRLPGDPYLGISAQQLRLYALFAAAGALTYGLLTRTRTYQVIAALSAVGWLIVTGGEAYAVLRRTMAGLDHIAWGMAFFLLAALISLTKAGVIQAWLERLRATPDAALELNAASGSSEPG